MMVIPMIRFSLAHYLVTIGAVAWLSLTAALPPLAAQVETGKVQGAVFTLDSDGTRYSVPGARVDIRGASPLKETVADEDGVYRFSDLTPGQYRIEVAVPGFTGSSEAIVTAGAVAEAPVQLQAEIVKESVTVTASNDTLLSLQTPESAIDKSTVINAPNKSDRADAVLPLIPGVVRGPDGLINMKGARATQSGSLINSASVNDPVTGAKAMSLPIDVVESVKVIDHPYDPEYGRFTGAVSSIDTVTGNFDAFHVTAQNLFVRPRKRDGDFVGIESWTPRITFTGPIVKDKVAFTQSFEYRFIRTPVSSLPQLQRDMRFEGVNSFSQVDVNISPRQSLTATFVVYPQKLNYLGLNTFTPQPSTPDLHERGYMASVQHRDAMGPETLLVSQVSYKQFDADVTANSNDPYELLVETTTGGFFDRQRRNSNRFGWQETFQFGKHDWLGSHQFKIGSDYSHSVYDGRIDLLPVSIIGVSELPLESIEFGPAARFTIRHNEMAWFVADKWTPFQRLTIDLGARFDWDSITSAVNTAPRFGAALMLTKDAKTILKGGVGLFYDRVPLNIASFPFLPDRNVTSFGAAGQILSTADYTNVIPAGLRNPRSVGWNIEFDRQINTALTVRVGYQERNTVRDFVLNPEAGPAILSLTNSGRSLYHEFQVTGQYKLRRGTVNASYVSSKAYGDLNDFSQFFGNNAVASIEPNARGRLPFDAPNRFLTWGEWQAPFKLTVLPVLDVHTGFPWSVINQEREFIGPRDGERFRRFTSFDLQVTRPVRLPLPHERLKARIGFSVFNLFNQFNPRDVQNDVDSERFGALFNGVGRTFRGKFILDF
jgi:carboxypeptidase family protein/TonB-dependent receptor-like protein